MSPLPARRSADLVVPLARNVPSLPTLPEPLIIVHRFGATGPHTETYVADAIENFVISQNISNYKAQLSKETHPDKRNVLLQLLENELAKLPPAARRAELNRTTRF